MKFSLCGVDLIFTKSPNKRSTIHIAAHMYNALIKLHCLFICKSTLDSETLQLVTS